MLFSRPHLNVSPTHLTVQAQAQGRVSGGARNDAKCEKI